MLEVFRRFGSVQYDPIDVAGRTPRPHAARARRGLRPCLDRRALRAARDLRGLQQGALVRLHARVPLVPRTRANDDAARDRGEPRGRQARARADSCRRAAVVARLRERAREHDRLVRRADQHRARAARGVHATRACSGSRVATASAGTTTSSSGCCRRSCFGKTCRWRSRCATSSTRAFVCTACSASAGAATSSAASAQRSPTRGTRASRPNRAARGARRERRHRSGSGRGRERQALRAPRGGRAAGSAAGAARVRRVPPTVRPAGLGPRPARLAVRVRLRVGALPPAGQAALGLVRAADPLRRPARRPHRAANRPRRRAGAR